jgi:hypothetical protein
LLQRLSKSWDCENFTFAVEINWIAELSLTFGAVKEFSGLRKVFSKKWPHRAVAEGIWTSSTILTAMSLKPRKSGQLQWIAAI